MVRPRGPTTLNGAKYPKLWAGRYNGGNYRPFGFWRGCFNGGKNLFFGSELPRQREIPLEDNLDEELSMVLWETTLRCTATVVALRVAARQRGACFEALYQRQNGLTKQHTKQTAADDLQVENELRELSSLQTKHDFRSPLVSDPPQFVLYVVLSIHSVYDTKPRRTHRADAQQTRSATAVAVHRTGVSYT
eukprot:6212111-Pleurochrysis_carterae.AAC.1